MVAKIATLVAVTEPSNGGAEDIAQSEPYVVQCTIEGASDILFHAWNPEAVDEKGRAAKNSVAKKTDNIESYVWRNDNRQICLPGEYLRGSIIKAAKFRQDPRSPRKSAMDLYKAAIVIPTLLSPIKASNGKIAMEWDYLDKRRVTVQRSGINRTRPAFHKGWTAEFDIMVMLPEYISYTDLHSVITNAGRLVGVGDFIPTFGRFVVTHYKLTAIE